MLEHLYGILAQAEGRIDEAAPELVAKLAERVAELGRGGGA